MMRQWMIEAARLCETFAWTEDAMREVAAEVVNDNSDGSPAYFDPYEGHWHYDPAFPVSAFTWIMSPDKWREWIANEIEMFTGDLGHDRGYTAMHTQDIIEPIVISLYQGKAYIWDGHHRIGVSFAKGATTIKAIVGERETLREAAHLEPTEMLALVRHVRARYRGALCGQCEGAASDLADLLAERGYSGTVINGRYAKPFLWPEGDTSPMSGHTWVKVGPWILDPTREQFGSSNLMIHEKDADALLYHADDVSVSFGLP